MIKLFSKYFLSSYNVLGVRIRDWVGEIKFLFCGEEFLDKYYMVIYINY